MSLTQVPTARSPQVIYSPYIPPTVPRSMIGEPAQKKVETKKYIRYPLIGVFACEVSLTLYQLQW